MKRLVLLVLSLTSCICAASCGSDNQTTSSSLDIDTEQYVVSSENTEETDEYGEIPDLEYPLVPECAENVNSDVRLQDVTIKFNTVEYCYDITSCATLQDFLNDWNEQQQPENNLCYLPFATTYMETNGFLFDSGMFGFSYDTASTNDSVANCMYEPDGTMTSIEVTQDGELVSSDDLDESKFDEYIIKGIHTDTFFTKTDYELVFCNNVKVGMPEEDLIAAIGEGTLYDESVRFYNNGSAVMVVETETSLDSDTVVVDEITLLSLTDE